MRELYYKIPTAETGRELCGHCRKVAIYKSTDFRFICGEHFKLFKKLSEKNEPYS